MHAVVCHELGSADGASSVHLLHGPLADTPRQAPGTQLLDRTACGHKICTIIILHKKQEHLINWPDQGSLQVNGSLSPAPSAIQLARLRLMAS